MNTTTKATSDHIAAHAEWRRLLKIAKPIAKAFRRPVTQLAADALGLSRATAMQYCVRPDRQSAIKPPRRSIDAFREAVIGARTVVDERDFLLTKADQEQSEGGRANPETLERLGTLSDAERLRHDWRDVAFGGMVAREVLAYIAGTDSYAVSWVGREHPEGIQPTEAMVLKARQAEAQACLARHRAMTSRSNKEELACAL